MPSWIIAAIICVITATAALAWLLRRFDKES